MTGSLIRGGRALGIGVLAGLLAGILVGGIGGRLAMRLVAIIAGPTSTGVRTDNGNAVGDITVGGTVALIVFAGVANGVIGGVVYAAVRPWLTSGRWRPLLFGLLVAAVLGFTAITPENPDFRRFGSPIVNVMLFAAIFLAFGALIVPLAGSLDRVVPGSVRPFRPAGIALSMPVAVSLLLGLLVIATLTVTTLQTLAGVAAPGTGFGLANSLVLLGLFGFAVVARLGSAFRWSYVPLVIPMLAGSWLTLRSMAAVLGVGG